jgi:CDP-diacylglycerol--glycerol-3-phosphate 3-phosphatidyltransferase
MNDRRALYKSIPNILSLTRMILVLPFVLLIHDIFRYACTKNLGLLLVFIAILLSDVADGYLARKLGCASTAGAKLDIISDTIYTVFSLAVFAYFNIVPIWFIVLMLLKLLEFMITSKLLQNRQASKSIVFFDKIGKLSISIVMLLPGIFVFRCIIPDYKMVMNVIIYIVTAMFAVSFIYRITKTLNPAGRAGR